MSKNKKVKTDSNKSTQAPQFDFVFEKSNFLWMGIGLAVIVLGFALMYGKTDIYDFRKTTLAPIVVLIGFGIQFYAIFKK
jgi:hypothetical protein